MAGEAAVDIQRLPSGHRMCADHRMFGAGIDRLVGDPKIPLSRTVLRVTEVAGGSAALSPRVPRG